MTMTYDEKKQWLWRYRESIHREKELSDEVKELRERAYNVSPALTGMPGGSSDGQELPRAVESITRAQQELECQINMCGAIRREIVETIEQVTNARDHEILRRRYLLGQKLEKISVEMNYNFRYVCKRHKISVCKLDIESDKKT